MSLLIFSTLVYFASQSVECSVHNQLIPTWHGIAEGMAEGRDRGETVLGMADQKQRGIKEEEGDKNHTGPTFSVPPPSTSFHLPAPHLAINSSVG